MNAIKVFFGKRGAGMVRTTGFPKRNEGQGEPIIDPELPIVDAHHHLFDRPALRYMLDDYRKHADSGHNVVGTVYVETQAMARTNGPNVMKAIGEVEFANGVAAICASGVYGPRRVAAAIVGFADMTLGAGIAPFLDRAMAVAPERFRGVRQIALAHPDSEVLQFLTHKPPADLLKSSAFGVALAELEKRGLSFDATVLHPQLPELATIADAYPDVTFVMDHMGLATAAERSPHARAEAFQEWRGVVHDLARRPNVVCKVGGLGTSYWGFDFYLSDEPVTSAELAKVWAPYVETVLDAFGFDRCMAESNFPNDGRSAGFVPLWNALKLCVSGASATEKAALFHGTAIRIYRMDLPEALLAE